MRELQIRKVKVSYGKLLGRPILNLERLEVKEKEILVIFGPNHSGKSTLLKVLAGVARGIRLSSSSQITYDGQPLRRFGRRKVSYVPQRYLETLFPWLSIADNLRLRLKIRGLSVAEQQEAVLALCKHLSCSTEDELYERHGFLAGGQRKKLKQLSGGQAQRLCLLRAVLPAPSLLLLDEPFSALDSFDGIKFRDRVFRYVETLGIATILVTHDLERAIDLADRIAILQPTERGSEIVGEYEVGRPRLGPNLDEKEKHELLAQIRREHGIN